MDVKERIAEDIRRARRQTEALLAPIDDQRLAAQPDPLMSPLVWDLAHIAVYEELWLVIKLSGSAPVDAERMLTYDAFEKPRRVRGELQLMTRAEVSAYRDLVDRRALDLLSEADLGGDDPLVRDAFVHTMVIEHEHQHQETILQSLQMLPGGYPIDLPDPTAPVAREHDQMVDIPGGVYPIGRSDHAPYDNEGPAHEVRLAPFRIDRFPVTCGRFRDFIEDGGYSRPELWAPSGRLWLAGSGERAPKHWQRDGEGWTTERFGTRAPIDWATPVMHVCWFEADAFARWAGRRLPTELEWEAAATWDPVSRRARRYPWGDDPPDAAHANVDQRRFRCSPVGAHPLGASASGCEQMIGDVWEWTTSDFLPYPGFRAFPYREYSEVFFGSEYKVLRGGSWATRPDVARAGFRNWDYPIRRQIFAGFRCAAQGDAS